MIPHLFRLFLMIAAASLFLAAADTTTALCNGTASYRLIGTVRSGPFAGAVLDDGAGKQEFYRVNERMKDGSQIVRVWRTRITIRQENGSLYDIYITHDKKTPSGAILPPAAPPASPINAAQQQTGEPPLPDIVKRMHERAERHHSNTKAGNEE